MLAAVFSENRASQLSEMTDGLRELRSRLDSRQLTSLEAQKRLKDYRLGLNWIDAVVGVGASSYEISRSLRINLLARQVRYLLKRHPPRPTLRLSVVLSMRLPLVTLKINVSVL